MIEVFLKGNRWAWRMICDQGRVLAYSLETYRREGQAFAAAKDYRARFWAVASGVDHRMAACI